MEILHFQIASNRDKIRKEIERCKILTRDSDLLQEFMNEKAVNRRAEQEKFIARTREESISGTKSTIENFRDAYGKIKAVCKRSDVRSISQRFQTLEDENFALYSFVNEQNVEIIRLEKDVERLTTQIIGLENDSNTAQLSAMEKHDKLESKLSYVTEELEAIETVLDSKRTDMDFMIKIVKSLFTRTESYNEPLAKFLGAGDIMPLNVISYIAVLENKLIELLLIHEYIKYKEFVASGQQKPTDYSLPQEEEVTPLTTKQPRALGPEHEGSVPKTVQFATRPLSTGTLKKAARSKLKIHGSKSSKHLKKGASSESQISSSSGGSLSTVQ